jgi:hypothetical protein
MNRRAKPRPRSDTACPACALDTGGGPPEDHGTTFLRGFAQGVCMAILKQGLAELCPRHQKVLDDALESRALVFKPATVSTATHH